jgi:hypothetical protein
MKKKYDEDNRPITWIDVLVSAILIGALIAFIISAVSSI